MGEGVYGATKAVDESLLVDPSLSFYRAMDRWGRVVVAQTASERYILDGLDRKDPAGLP
jgi:hypothetical protein